MQKIYKDIAAIERFTSTLQSTPSLQCQYCAKHAHFISHGFVYKQHSIALKEAVGKRIICCDRYGHQGCGRTYQLDIASKLPHQRYSATVLFLFISFILLGDSICSAYTQATKQGQTRNAWRWLKKLKTNLIHYRGALKVPITHIPLMNRAHFTHHRILLTTLAAMTSTGDECPCATFQLKQQIAFI
jgi:hypothetical protein